MAQGGIPGIAVGMAGAAALLIYAGFQGVDPLTALRDVATGKPKGLAEKAAARTALYEGVGVEGGSGGGVAQASLAGVSGPHPEFVNAAAGHAHEVYSQLKRWQPGYSDCSSFVAKSMRAAGIDVDNKNTTGFMAWPYLKRISKSEIGRGDLLINHTHMAIALDGQRAIGQQNKNRNVATGSFEAIMMNTGPWSAYRYVGPGGERSAAV